MNDLTDFIAAVQELDVPYDQALLKEKDKIPLTVACNPNFYDSVKEALGMYCKVETTWLLRGEDKKLLFDWYK